ELAINDEDTSETLAPRLAAIGADLMLETLQGLPAGTITPRPQDHSAASLAPILNKEDGRIDFTRTAQEIYNRFRGFQPWPGAFTTFRGRNLNVTAMKPASDQIGAEANTLGQLLVTDGRIFVRCGDDTSLE